MTPAGDTRPNCLPDKELGTLLPGGFPPRHRKTGTTGEKKTCEDLRNNYNTESLLNGVQTGSAGWSTFFLMIFPVSKE